MEIKNVTFVGLGVMGYNMAGHLKKNNFNTTVYNRTSSVAEKWVGEFSGKYELTAGKAVSNADIVFICVGKDIFGASLKLLVIFWVLFTIFIILLFFKLF